MNRRLEKEVKIAVNAEVELDGLLCLQQDQTNCCPAIVCHPHPAYGGTMRNNVVEAVVGEFIERGVTTLRFNFRSAGGKGALDGENDGFCDEVQDLLAAIAFLEEELGRRAMPVCLVGYSFGSYIALRVAQLRENVKAVCGIAPPVSSMNLEGVGQFDRPKYFIHGLLDSYGPPEAFDLWYRALPQPKEATEMDADHFYSGLERSLAKRVADCLLE